MTPTPIEVTVVVPFDWVTGILVPAASILVSAGIAVWLARRERRAADRDRVGGAASRLIRSLTELAYVREADGPEVDDALRSVEGSLNEFSASLDAADADVPKYVSIVLDRAIDADDPEAVNRTSMFLVGAVEGWVRDQLSTDDFTRTMPPDADSNWVVAVRLDDWRVVSSPQSSTTSSAKRRTRNDSDRHRPPRD